MWLEIVSVGIYVVFEESIGDRIERVSELSPPTPPERRHMMSNCPCSCGNVGSCFFCCRDDDGVSFILVGLVSGNPGICFNEGDFPHYFTLISHKKVKLSPYPKFTLKEDFIKKINLILSFEFITGPSRGI